MRYPALRFIVAVQYFFALCVLCVVMVATLRAEGLAAKIPILLGGAIGIVALLAFAEVLRVLMDIEENTRGHAEPRSDASAPAAIDAPLPPLLRRSREMTRVCSREMVQVTVSA